MKDDFLQSIQSSFTSKNHLIPLTQSGALGVLWSDVPAMVSKAQKLARKGHISLDWSQLNTLKKTPIWVKLGKQVFQIALFDLYQIYLSFHDQNRKEFFQMANYSLIGPSTNFTPLIQGKWFHEVGLKRVLAYKLFLDEETTRNLRLRTYAPVQMSLKNRFYKHECFIEVEQLSENGLLVKGIGQRELRLLKRAQTAEIFLDFSPLETASKKKSILKELRHSKDILLASENTPRYSYKFDPKVMHRCWRFPVKFVKDDYFYIPYNSMGDKLVTIMPKFIKRIQSEISEKVKEI